MKWLYFFLLCITSESALSDEPARLSWVFGELSREGNHSLYFYEKKNLAILNHSLETTGRMYFEPPDRVIREPSSSHKRYIIQGGQMIQEEDGVTTRTVDIEDHPSVRAFSTALVSLLGGDASKLRDNFHASLTGVRSDWLLSLTPIHELPGELLKSIDIRGEQGNIISVRMLYTNNDSSLLLLSPSPLPGS